MDRSAIEVALQSAEEAVESGKSLTGTGFWTAVAAVKAAPDLADAYSDRIGAIDRRAFHNWALLRVPLRVGTSLMAAGSVIGLGFVWWSYYLTDLPAAIAFLIGFGILMVTTHGLGHLAVGTVLGIGFTDWFIGTIRMPQPGVKTDYTSYLRASGRARAWMHASGAIATKLTPFALIGASVASGVPSWVTWLLVLVGFATIATDVLWSTKSSDWMKFRRELRSSHIS